MAGITRLMNHTEVVTKLIPTRFEVNILNIAVATKALFTTSKIATVGMNAMVNNKMAVDQKLKTQFISISKNRNSRKY